MKKIRQILFFLLILGGVFTTAKTQNYDSIVSKIYEYNDSSEPDTVEGSSKKALGEWMRFYENRLDEDGNIDTYIKNLNSYYDNNSSSDIDMHWEYIGHTNNYHHYGMTMHGLVMRIWADTTDYNHILAGTELNGLWETFDNGDNWVCISDSEPEIKGISSLEVINDTIYIASLSTVYSAPEYTIGLFYTADHGETWQKQSVIQNGNSLYDGTKNGSVFYAIQQWLHHPLYKNIQFVLTDNYLFESIDYGQNFDTVFYKPLDSIWYNPWIAENSIKKMLINPNNPNELFVSGPELLRVSIPQYAYGHIIENMTNNLVSITNDTILVKYTDIGASKLHKEILWFSAENTYGDLFMTKYNDNTNTYTTFPSNTPINSYHFLRQIEVSPFDDNTVSAGYTHNLFFAFSDTAFSKKEIGNVHFDVRATKLYNENGHLIQLQGTDGGIGKVTFSDTSIYSNYTLEDITNDGENGIINYHMNAFDVSTFSDNDMMLLAQDHNGVAFAKNEEDWLSILQGMDDGKWCQFAPSNPNDIYGVGSDYKKLFHYDAQTDQRKKIYQFSTLKFNNKYHFFVDPNESRTVYTGEYGNLVSINCYNLDYVVTNSFPLTKNILPSLFAMRDFQNYLYVVNNRKMSSDSILFKFEHNPYTGELSLEEDLSAGIHNIDPTNNAKITSIALDLFDADHFWVSFGGTSDFPKIWETFDDGNTYNPQSNGIPNDLPINELLFDRLTQKVFAVNDIGIYYLNPLLNEWKNISGDLPPIFCNFIRFSPDHKKIRLGSKSRGPWEASLCIYEENPIHIHSNVNWFESKQLYSDLIIDNGGTLAVFDTVYVTSKAHIIVREGGKLIIEGGKITSSCDDLWEGIQVANGGILNMERGTIENAKIAIRNYLLPPAIFQSGGKINIKSSVFKNNEKTGDFKHDFSNNHIVFSALVDQGNIIFNRIIIDSAYMGSSPPVNNFSIIDASAKLNFISATNTSDFSIGSFLYAHNAHISLQYISVDNFSRGFYLVNSDYSIINNSNFSNTQRAIYANNCNNLKIQNDTLYLPTYPEGIQEESYGLYLEHCTDYTVEDNLFIGDNDGDGCPPEEKAHIGLYINNSGAGDNLINNNTFENIRYATVSYGQNKGNSDPATGLCYKCNTFIDNSNDIRILKLNDPTGTGEPQGIAENQGANIPTDPSSPAGNQFSYTGPEGSFSDINNKAEHFTYYYHANQPLVNLEPKYYSNKTVTTVEVSALWNEDSCDEGNDTIPKNELLLSTQTNRIKADSIQNFISVIEDGGNPENLRDLVANSLPSEAYQVYIALMAQTPELSDTTIAKAIEKEEVLAPVMIRDIMAANPKSSKSDELIEKLEERNQPLPDYMLGQILQGRSLGDFMTDLYAKRSYYTKAYHQGIEAMVSDYLADSLLSPMAQLDSALYLLQAQNDVYFDKQILHYTAAKKDYAQVQQMLNNQLDNPKLLDYQEQELEGWQSYYQILASISEEEPDSIQLAAFNSLWLDDKGAASAAARAYLQTYAGLEYDEPLYLGDEMYSNGPNEHFEDLVQKAEAHQYMELYPNPAKDYLIVKFDLEMEYLDALIQISDMRGMILETQKLKASKNQILIPTKDYKEGTYTLQLSFGKQARETHKFSVIH